MPEPLFVTDSEQVGTPGIPAPEGARKKRKESSTKSFTRRERWFTSADAFARRRRDT